jgi:hypothetical protein
MNHEQMPMIGLTGCDSAARLRLTRTQTLPANTTQYVPIALASVRHSERGAARTNHRTAARGRGPESERRRCRCCPSGQGVEDRCLARGEKGVEEGDAAQQDSCR